MNYSQNAREQQNNKRRRRRKKKKNLFGVIILKVFIVLFLVGSIAAAGMAFGAFMGIVDSAPTLNTEDVVPESYTSIIYDLDGNEIDRLHGEENREYVKLSSIPVDLRNAVVAIEDQRFYEHNGIDLKGIMRAMVVNIKDMNFTQGASTITQQLMKNEVLSSEKKLKRKIQEQYLAVQIEDQLTESLGSKQKAKEYILELYMNSIGLHHGLNGVQAASKFYFGKDVSELNLAECACIAGITKNPSAYSPVSRPEKNKERQTTVLNKMLELGYINQSEYDEAIADDIYSRLVGETVTDVTEAKHSYFVDSVIVALADDLMNEKQMSKQQAYNLIYSGGLKIYTTIDTDMQQMMEESFQNESLYPPNTNHLTASYTISVMDTATEEQTHIFREKTVANQEEADEFVQSVKDEVLTSSNTLVADNLKVAKSLQASMVVMDYRNGQVKAIVGGREKNGDLVFNRATQALRQPGSCFKVLAAFAPALDLGVAMPGSFYLDEPLEFSDGWAPGNWYGTEPSDFRGYATVRDGVKDSLNIIATKALLDVGVDNAFSYLENFGFTTLEGGVNNNGLTDKGGSLALGGITNGVSTLELTAAYSAIANEGVYNKPIFYTKVLDHDGNVIIDHTLNEGRRVLKETTAYMVTEMMKDVITSGTGGLARLNGITVAGKTGTTSDDKDLVFAGYTPYYCAGVWMGYDTPKRINYDKSYHLLLWKDVMTKIHEGLPNQNIMEKPSGLSTVSICAATNAAPTEICGSDYYSAFNHYPKSTSSDLCETGFTTETICEAHRMFQICKVCGKVASTSTSIFETMDVVLAVDESNNIINLPETMKDAIKNGTEIPSGGTTEDGKELPLYINLSETCGGTVAHIIDGINDSSIFDSGILNPDDPFFEFPQLDLFPEDEEDEEETEDEPVIPIPLPSTPVVPENNDGGSIFG